MITNPVNNFSRKSALDISPSPDFVHFIVDPKPISLHDLTISLSPRDNTRPIRYQTNRTQCGQLHWLPGQTMGAYNSETAIRRHFSTHSTVIHPHYVYKLNLNLDKMIFYNSSNEKFKMKQFAQNNQTTEIFRYKINDCTTFLNRNRHISFFPKMGHNLTKRHKNRHNRTKNGTSQITVGLHYATFLDILNGYKRKNKFFRSLSTLIIEQLPFMSNLTAAQLSAQTSQLSLTTNYAFSVNISIFENHSSDLLREEISRTISPFLVVENNNNILYKNQRRVLLFPTERSATESIRSFLSDYDKEHWDDHEGVLHQDPDRKVLIRNLDKNVDIDILVKTIIELFNLQHAWGYTRTINIGQSDTLTLESLDKSEIRGLHHTILRMNFSILSFEKWTPNFNPQMQTTLYLTFPGRCPYSIIAQQLKTLWEKVPDIVSLQQLTFTPHQFPSFKIRIKSDSSIELANETLSGHPTLPILSKWTTVRPCMRCISNLFHTTDQPELCKKPTRQRKTNSNIPRDVCSRCGSDQHHSMVCNASSARIQSYMRSVAKGLNREQRTSNRQTRIPKKSIERVGPEDTWASILAVGTPQQHNPADSFHTPPTDTEQFSSSTNEAVNNTDNGKTLHKRTFQQSPTPSKRNKGSPTDQEPELLDYEDEQELVQEPRDMEIDSRDGPGRSDV
jgi:hypothetical protein